MNNAIRPTGPRAWKRRLAALNACNRRARRNAARVLSWVAAQEHRLACPEGWAFADTSVAS